MFGGNSNWRGPVWFPVNYLLIEALERYHHFYGDDFRVECPTGSGRLLNLARGGAARSPSGWRGCSCPTQTARRPCHGDGAAVRRGPALAGLRAVLRVLPRRHRAGAGANHQTGWTALIARLFEDCARKRRKPGEEGP